MAEWFSSDSSADESEAPKLEHKRARAFLDIREQKAEQEVVVHWDRRNQTVTTTCLQEVDVLEDDEPPMRAKIESAFEGVAWQCVVAFLLVIALFLSDIRQLGMGADADAYVDGIIFGLFLFFTCEVVVNSIFLKHYFLSFYFWADLVGTFSLLFDISWIVESILSDDVRAAQNGSILRVGRAARAGARFGRLIRVLRLVRVVRLFHFYQNFELSSSEEESHPSYIGALYADTLAKRVMAGIVSLFIVMPFLQETVSDSGALVGVETLIAVPADSFDLVLPAVLTAYESAETKVVKLVANGVTVHEQVTQLVELRSREINKLFVQEGWEVWVDVKASLDKAALFQIVWLIVSVFLIFMFVWVLSRDATRMVVKPIERMVMVVGKVAETITNLASTPSAKLYETHFLEEALSKMASLLRVGFGEAGQCVIGKNLLRHGDFEPLVAGTQVQAIFGFCDIRNFTDTTEILQEEILMYVNGVAEVVHSQVVTSGGCPNKNIGDAFLSVWKLDPNSDLPTELQLANGGFEDKTFVRPSPSLRNESTIYKRHGGGLADRALTAFLEICVTLENNEDPLISHYATKPELVKHIGVSNVLMGFGLHVGWAIEGAIGSNEKIDASYLSPHVNLSARLESATKFYGVQILLSSSFYDMLSVNMKKLCRPIDRVTLKGSTEPLTLYSASTKHYLSAGNTSPSQQQRKIIGLSTDMLRYFVDGKWKAANSVIEEIRSLDPQDKATLPVQAYMKKFKLTPPKDWPGYRALDEK